MLRRLRMAVSPRASLGVTRFASPSAFLGDLAPTRTPPCLSSQRVEGEACLPEQTYPLIEGSSMDGLLKQSIGCVSGFDWAAAGLLTTRS
jgi:hypothetical protein